MEALLPSDGLFHAEVPSSSAPSSPASAFNLPAVKPSARLHAQGPSSPRVVCVQPSLLRLASLPPLVLGWVFLREALKEKKNVHLCCWKDSRCSRLPPRPGGPSITRHSTRPSLGAERSRLRVPISSGFGTGVFPAPQSPSEATRGPELPQDERGLLLSWQGAVHSCVGTPSDGGRGSNPRQHRSGWDEPFHGDPF